MAFFIKGDRILLIPPTELVGSFGDELMVLSFIQQLHNEKIDIYTETDRRDLFAPYGNVYFRNSRKLIKWHKYKSVQVLGADMMSGSYGDYLPLHYIHILRIANKLCINTKILGFSLKKKNSEMVMDRLRQISKNTKLFLRDVDSFERAKELGLNNIELVADLAFLTQFQEIQEEIFESWLKRNQGRKIVAICPNALHARSTGLEKYIQDFSKFIQAISNDQTAFLFLYHDLRPQCGEHSDFDISRMLYVMIEKENASFLPSSNNGIEMKYYISKCDVTITGRMHFGISGLSAKIPMIGISYEDKFSGLQKLFGIAPTESLLEDYSHISKDTEKVSEFLKSIDNYKFKVEEFLPAVKELAIKNFS